MKKYFLLSFLVAFMGCVTLQAADFAELLKKLDSDYSASLTAENDVSWLGTTGNPNGGLDAFQARYKIRNMINATFGSEEKMAEINAFFVDVLQKDVQVTTKVWVLEQLAGTATAKEVPVIASQLDSDNQRVVDAAAAALVLIPGPEATAALQAKKGCPAADYSLKQKSLANPPLLPNESVMPFALANATQAEVDAWMAKYDSFDELVKAQTLAGLTARNDKKYNAVAVAAMNSDSEILQNAGFIALEKLATANDVPALLAKLATDSDRTIRLCGFVVADGFDAALVDALKKAENANEMMALITILTNRATDIRAIVFEKTMGDECANRLELLQKIAKIVTPADTDALVASTLKFPLGGERDQAENIIATTLKGDATPVIALIGKYDVKDLFSIIGRIGGNAAKAEINKGLASTDADVQKAAIRALSVWPDAKFADEMFAIATDDSYTVDQKIAALRSFIRVISLPDDKIGISISKDGKLAKLQEAFKIAMRVDEKRLILSRLAANRTAKSLQFAVECAADPELAQSAYYAIADHAHDNVLRQQNMDVFGPAMELVINNSTDKNLVERVMRYKEQK